jgi:hypothetical protein
MKSKKDIQRRIEKLTKRVNREDLCGSEPYYFEERINELRWVLGLKPKQSFEGYPEQGGGF